jgi:hypothetical protein
VVIRHEFHKFKSWPPKARRLARGGSLRFAGGSLGFRCKPIRRGMNCAGSGRIQREVTSGFRQFRVRYHEELPRIEIASEEMPRALDPAMARKFVEIFKGLGFKFVTLDLEGYRTGSMNPLLVKIQK